MSPQNNIMDDHKALEIVAATPLISIDLIIENDTQQILLGLRANKPAQNYWFVPGGRIKKNELINNAFTRILNAETGIHCPFEDARLLGAFNHIYNDNFLDVPGINTHYVVLAFKVDLHCQAQIQGDNQHKELRWWPKEQLLEEMTVHQNTKAYFI